jgi:hypothetical protein
MTSRTHLKNGRSPGNGVYVQMGTTLRVMEAIRPIVLDQMAASVPEIMDTSNIYI